MNLIEVLIALVIFSCVLLGLGCAQLNAYRLNRDAMTHSLIVSEIASLQEQLYLLEANYLSLNAEIFKQSWQNQIKQKLPIEDVQFHSNDQKETVIVTYQGKSLAMDLLVVPAN